MQIRFRLAASATALSIAAISAPSAFAQSTGSVDFDEEIVVTGQASTDIAGVDIPDTPKAKQVLTQEFISKQNPGQTVLDSINAIPGVSFQNNDAFGSAGGTLTIRGFGGDRISLTFDGVPLNDSGNYAIYSNQQLSPELIEQVNVNLGSTDVDSPTASATGGTVNYRTRLPYEEFGVRAAGSMGDFGFMRIFASVDTGNLTSSGTRLFIAGEKVDHRNVYRRDGKVDKTQFNARLYQPIGDNGDFVSVSGNYNRNVNNFFGSVGINTLIDANGNVTLSRDDRFGQGSARCLVDVPQNGVADTSNRCGSAFDRRYNPSNTGNIRGASKFTLSDGLVLTIDPSFQFVKANGGGTTRGYEYGRNDADRNGANGGGIIGFIGGRPYTGVDLNGDGDLLDEVEILQPSHTQTRRIGVISSLRYEINDTNMVRLSYTFDRARHRQTGQIGSLLADGTAVDPFPIDDPIIFSDGTAIGKRDRLSYATLHQISGEYRGEFIDDKLLVTLGVRAPFFKRELNQYCFTTSASGFVDCFGQGSPTNATYAAANPGFAPPQSRTYTYNKLLPNAGFRFKLTPDLSMFGSYAKGLSVPGTDPLYDSLFFAANTAGVRPVPETTDSGDLGIRFSSGRIQAQVSGWYTKFNNRLARSYDPVLDQTVYRNLGDVDKYGVDGSIAFAAADFLRFYVFGSIGESDIKSDVLLDNVACTANQVSSFGCITRDGSSFAPTTGKRESGSPTNSYGGAFDFEFGPVSLGALAKRTGKRYVNDVNTLAVEPYWLVNLNARLNLEFMGLNDKTFLQFNLYNAFDEVFVGGFGGDLTGTSPFVQIGAPRTFTGSINFQF